MAITLRGDGDTTFDNNIGIGTTSPGEALHVHATGTTQIAAEFEADNAQSYIEFTGTDSTQILYGRDGADACIQTAGNDVFKALSNGNCSIVDGNLVVASGHGIDFSATGNSSGTMSSELLDDYEEGTWTPSVTVGVDNGAGGTATYQRLSGRYTKIGNLVTVDFYIQFAVGTDSTGLGPGRIGNLPFAISNLQYGGGTAGLAQYTRGGGGPSYVDIDTADNKMLTFYGAASASHFHLYTNGDNFSFGADGTDLSSKYLIGQYIYNA